MAKFKFKLQAVEKVRIQKEQKMLEELAVSRRSHQAKINHKNALIERKRLAFLESQVLLNKNPSVNEVRLLDEYIAGLKHQMVMADQAIIRARRFLDQAMRHYLLARRGRLMIDKIKEKAMQEFKSEQAKKEQRELDDLISMRLRLKNPETTEAQE